jgi:hypothetical protein
MRRLAAIATRDKVAGIKRTGKDLLSGVQYCLEAASRALANISEPRLLNVHLPLYLVELSQNFGRQGFFEKSSIKARRAAIPMKTLEFQDKLFGLSTDT